MGVHLSPVGPLPSSVYWRRRAALVLGLLVLLFLLSQCTGGDDAEPTAESLTPSSAALPPSAAPGPSSPVPAATPSAAPATPATPRPTPAGLADCTDADLSVSADTDEDLYELGSRPELTLRIANSSDVPCRRGIGAGSVELQVRSGSDRIWSSDDCGGKGRPGVTTLAPDDAKAATVSWDGRRSRPGCRGDAERIQPGTYRLVGRVGELVVEGAVFTVGP